MALGPPRETNCALVYKATNLVNQKAYIGFTTQGLPRRVWQHHASLNQKGGCRRLKHAMNKHGKEAFVFEVMADFAGDEELAKLYECEAIAKYKPEYNLSYGGEGGTMHPETRRRISQNTRGPRPHTRGVKRAPEVVANLRAKLMGHVISDETRSKISTAHKQYWSLVDDETKAQRKAQASKAVKKLNESRKRPIKCVNDGRIFGSSKEAAHFYGLSYAGISGVLHGTYKTTKGFVFVRHEVSK